MKNIVSKKTCGANTRSDGVNPVPIMQTDPPIANSVPTHVSI